MNNPVQIKREDDGTLTLIYFGKVVGWIRKDHGMRLWRAMTVHGDILHRASLDSARAALMQAHH
jgi:hypothetical protein